MDKKIYILIASGSYLCFEGYGTILCSKCFTNKSLAEKEVPDFTEKVKEDRGGMFELAPDTVKVIIKELELVE